MGKLEQGREKTLRPLWAEADSLRERVANATSVYAFFSFDAALAQRASNGHSRTNPAARAALIRLCAAPDTRAAVLSSRKAELLQKRLRLQRLAYVGVHGADVHAFGLRLVTEPDLEHAETAIQKLRRACARSKAFSLPGIVLEDRTFCLVLNLRNALAADQIAAAEAFGMLAAGEGLQLRRGEESLEALPQGTGIGRAALGLLVGMREALPVYVGAGESDEEAFAMMNRRGGITVHVGPSPRTGTAAKFQVADCGEVIRLIHWLADARRRSA